MPTQLYATRDLAERNIAAGGAFFDPKEMQRTSTRVSRWAVDGPGGCFFVASDRDNGRRSYTVHRFDFKTSRIFPSGARFFKSGGAATAAARRLAEGDV